MWELDLDQDLTITDDWDMHIHLTMFCPTLDWEFLVKGVGVYFMDNHYIASSTMCQTNFFLEFLSNQPKSYSFKGEFDA